MATDQRLWVPTSEADLKADPKKPVWELAARRVKMALHRAALACSLPPSQPHLSCTQADVVGYTTDGTSADVKLNGRSLTVKTSTCHTFDPSHDRDYDDAGKMADLHEAPLLKLLGKRHARDAIYTWSGEILLSVNPYFLIEGLYDAAEVRGTLRRPSIEHYEASGGTVAAEVVSGEAADEGALPPHIFSVADVAYKKVRTTAAQVLVVNGESGARERQSRAARTASAPRGRAWGRLRARGPPSSPRAAAPTREARSTGEGRPILAQARARRKPAGS